MKDYREMLLALVEEEVLDKDFVILALVKYMTQEQIRDVLRLNEMVPVELLKE